MGLLLPAASSGTLVSSHVDGQSDVALNESVRAIGAGVDNTTDIGAIGVRSFQLAMTTRSSVDLTPGRKARKNGFWPSRPCLFLLTSGHNQAIIRNPHP